MFGSLLPEFQEISWTPQVGDLVVNFGQPARVLEVRESGLILREVGGSQKWLADPQKCRPAR